MLTSFRRLTKSTVGTIVLALFGVAIVASFAIADVTGLGFGGPSVSSSTLAKVGSLEITEQEMSAAMQRRLAEIREQNPEADYSAVAGDFEPLLQSLIDQKALQAFARKHGFVISKRLVDAEIANLPGVRGLDGKFSQAAYEQFLARQRMTDAEVRDIIEASMIQRMLLVPAASNPFIPVGVATPYASMLLERREADIALVPVTAFAAGLSPTDAQLQQFYAANRNRYMVPEQRSLRIARIGPEQVANVAATDAEIAKYYQQNQEQYGAKDIRVISQAVVPEQSVANQIAARARGGQSFVEAAKPAGFSAEDVSIGPQTRSEFAGLAGDEVAAAAFNAPEGAIVGPIQSDLGWHVIKIDDVQRQAGRSLAEVRSEIAAKITADKRTEALADLLDKVQNAIDEGSNLQEAAQTAGLPVTTTPLITASGVARGDSSFRMPPELQAAVTSGFDLARDDAPVIEQLGGEQGFAVVAPAQIIEAAPAPLASIREQVKTDWVQQQAIQRAQAAAKAIAARAENSPLAEAVKQVKPALPPVQDIAARRMELTQMTGEVPQALRLMFAIPEGRTRVARDPQGRGFVVVKVTKVIPGNALAQPGLIPQVQQALKQPLQQEYAQEFIGAVRKELDVRRNEDAIRAARERIVSGG